MHHDTQMTECALKTSIIRLFPVFTLLAACATPEPEQSSRSAQFAEYPDQLFSTFEISCEGPEERFTRPERSSFECRSSLPPETTAFLILNYDGYPQDLPKGVRRMSSTRNQAGYRVDAELFFLVPQKDGATIKVPVESSVLDDELTRLYRYFGGTPL